ncbi:MAG: ABC transporter permease [Candidatus Izemoplasmataceae bacterium]
MKTLIKYDFFYLKRTAKFIIFPALAFLLAVISPLTAKYMNQILEFALGSEDLPMTFPDPTVMDSYTQYLGNLYEMFILVVIFVSVGIFVRDKAKVLIPLILTKPISRTKYLLSKYITFNILVFISLIIGYLVFSYYTFILFDEVDMLGMFYGTLLYMLYVLFITSIALFASAVFDTYILAMFFTFGIYIIINIFNIFKSTLFQYFPGRIINAITEILVGTIDAGDVVFYILVPVIFIAAFMVVGIKLFLAYDFKA